ncbi:MAG: hypothetical protein MZU97_21535 [Bacillus subtilis]|nr:hypothetical protein [Bacillus subtilis]
MILIVCPGAFHRRIGASVGSNFNKITRLNLENYLAIVEEDYEPRANAPGARRQDTSIKTNYLRITIIAANRRAFSPISLGVK